jgi:hypothetical protein
MRNINGYIYDESYQDRASAELPQQGFCAPPTLAVSSNAHRTIMLPAVSVTGFVTGGHATSQMEA